MLPKMHMPSEKWSNITAAILAGGKSSRMGRDKALLEFNGKPFIQYIADAMQEVFKKVIIISDHGELYQFLGLPIYKDIFKYCGPLGGIHSAFAHTKTKSIFIASCDIPLLTPELIRSIIDTPFQGDVIVLPSGKSIQPLCGLYSRNCVPTLEKHLKNGQYSVLRFLEDLSTIIVAPKMIRERRLVDVNTPGQYKILLKSPIAQKKKDNSV